jgi:hypothetical protein
MDEDARICVVLDGHFFQQLTPHKSDSSVVDDMPNASAAVVGDEHTPVLPGGDTDWPSPNRGGPTRPLGYHPIPAWNSLLDSHRTVDVQIRFPSNLPYQ